MEEDEVPLSQVFRIEPTRERANEKVGIQACAIFVLSSTVPCSVHTCAPLAGRTLTPLPVHGRLLNAVLVWRHRLP